MYVSNPFIYLIMRVVLPSNASMKHFPDNTLAKYTVQLPQSLNLSHGRWEFGLSEIQFAKSWYNITKANLKIIKNRVQTNIQLDDGYYETPQQFIEHINDKIHTVYKETSGRLISFHFNKVTRLCEIKTTANKEITLEFSKNLEQILGYTTKQFNRELKEMSNIYPSRGDIVKEVTIPGSLPVRLDSIFNLMVYCDIAQSTTVGDVEAPLLRAVPVNKDHWINQCTEFSNIQYLPIAQKNVRSISIYIYTDFGELVPFVYGRTVCTLNFRRIDHSTY